MPSLSTSVTINQPVEKVFNYVVAVENHKTWQAGIVEAQLTPNGPVALGSIYTYTTEVMGHKIQSQLQVTAFEPNVKWAVKTTGIPNPVETVYLFEAVDSGSRLTLSMDVPVGAYPAAVESMVKEQMLKSLKEQGARIQQAVG